MRLFAVIFPFVATVMAVSNPCTSPEIRVEWSSLTQDQRNSYHKAVKCLQTKDDDIVKDQNTTLFDRFARNHVDMFGSIHYVAAFLPWHRYFSLSRSHALKNCSYDGPTPYWDWTKNVNNMPQSEIFDSVKGFGGNSRGNRVCVERGPYSTQSNFTLNWPEKRCLQRKFNMATTTGSWWRPPTGPNTRHSQSQIDYINNQTKFIDFWSQLEEGPHDSVHNEINSDMAASFSPADPLFFLHHNNIDRLWALWQGRDPQRLQEYGGNTVQGQSRTDGSRYPLATLDDTIDVGIPGSPPVKVRDLMDTQGPTLCYKYDN